MNNSQPPPYGTSNQHPSAAIPGPQAYAQQQPPYAQQQPPYAQQQPPYAQQQPPYAQQQPPYAQQQPPYAQQPQQYGQQPQQEAWQQSPTLGAPVAFTEPAAEKPSFVGRLWGNASVQTKLYIAAVPLALVAAIGVAGYMQLTYKSTIIVDNPTSSALTVKAYGQSIVVPPGKSANLEIDATGDSAIDASIGGKPGPAAKVTIPGFRVMAFFSPTRIYVPVGAKLAVVPMGYGSHTGGDVKILEPGLHEIKNLSSTRIDEAFPSSVSLKQTKNSKPTGKVLTHLCHVSGTDEDIRFGCPGAN